jgi:prepilin-type N-terminal cleavage/methylation domain-containing protein
VARLPAGFTLFELMLVMMIILVAAAVSIPAIDAMMGDSRVKAARDLVRARWADIRGRAILEGRPYKFSIIENTGKFRIEPEDGNTPSDDGDDPLIAEEELPGQVPFVKDQASAGAASGAGDYETLAVYLPDGTARDDVQIMFGKQGGRLIGLQLRALTGAVTMVEQTQDNRP